MLEISGGGTGGGSGLTPGPVFNIAESRFGFSVSTFPSPLFELESFTGQIGIMMLKTQTLFVIIRLTSGTYMTECVPAWFQFIS